MSGPVLKEETSVLKIYFEKFPDIFFNSVILSLT